MKHFLQRLRIYLAILEIRAAECLLFSVISRGSSNMYNVLIVAIYFKKYIVGLYITGPSDMHERTLLFLH